MKKKQTKIFTVLFVLFSSLFFTANTCLSKAQTTDYGNFNTYTKTFNMVEGEKTTVDVDGDSYPDLMVQMLGFDANGRPKIETTSLIPTQEGGQQYAPAPFIGQYIAAMYKTAIMLIGALATIFIIFAGVQWIMSGGSPDKINSAKQMIARSITGLVIALGSYALLFAINPDLVSFRTLQVLRVAATAVIPEDRTMPAGSPEDPPDNLVSLANIDDVNFGSGADARASAAVAAALKSVMDEYEGEVVISTAYRSPISQYSLMTAQCGCKPVDILFQDEKNKNISAGDWGSNDRCTKLAGCKIGYKTLAVKDGIFQTPKIVHFGGNALDISAALTGAVKPCGDISIDDLSKKSEGVVNAGQWKENGQWCIPKPQQDLIKIMKKYGFCVGIKDGSTLREPWHFELIVGGTGFQKDFCTALLSDPNIDKLKYVTLQ